MFMAFIVMHVGGENDNSGAEVLLLRLQRLGQLSLLKTAECPPPNICISDELV